MDFLTSPQLWLALAFLFLIAELIHISFVFVFLGLGALATALLAWLGLTPHINSQLLSFAIITVATLIIGRRPLRHWFDAKTKKQEYVEYVGDQATVTQTIPAIGEGRIAYRGTEWIAVSDRQEAILVGQHVVIRRMDGIRAIVDLV